MYRVAARVQRLVRDNSIVQEKQGQQNQKDDPGNCTPNQLLPEKEPTYEHANHNDGERADQRIASCCLGESDQVLYHCRFRR